MTDSNLLFEITEIFFQAEEHNRRVRARVGILKKSQLDASVLSEAVEKVSYFSLLPRHQVMNYLLFINLAKNA